MNDRELESLLAEWPTPSLPARTLLRLIRAADAAHRTSSPHRCSVPWWAAAAMSLAAGLLTASVAVLVTAGWWVGEPRVTEAPHRGHMESQRPELPAAELRMSLPGDRDGSVLVYCPEFVRSRSTLPDIPPANGTSLGLLPLTEEVVQ